VTEKQWVKCRYVEEQLDLLTDKATKRKLRLFAVACCQRIAHLLLDPRSQAALWAAERLAEGERKSAGRELGVAAEAYYDASGKGCRDARFAACQVVAPSARGAARYTAANALAAVRWDQRRDTRIKKGTNAPSRVEKAAQLSLMRDIFGNPFRPVKLDRTWLTSDVLALARGIYAERAFDRMPILADALQDAGCANEDVLAHCRDTQLTHVRGCWVVDLLLGKR
jgi:hypothetical protein